MRVLSLFDGISCARVALDRANIRIQSYYASEVDKYAIQIAQKNYPDTVHLGDVKGVDGSSYGPVDLLIGGSPCQDLSIAKKNRKGLKGERSGLFWEYVRILKEAKPKWFILENVASMKNEDKQVITDTLGVEPIMIDASLVSAQNRKRLFWTNIPKIFQPKDRGILLRDQLVGGYNKVRKDSRKYKEGKPRFYEGKCPTLSANMGTAGGHIPIVYEADRKMTPIECERLQGLPDNYTEGVSNTQRYKGLGNAFNVDVVAHILSYL